jgi:hypothetical protein
MELHFHSFLPSALDGRECLASPPARFSPGGSASGTQWVGQRADLYTVVVAYLF